MPRVLITGGSGRVGKATVERLLADGWDVRAIGLEANFAYEGAEYQCCNVLNLDDLRAQMRGCDAVIHLAAIPNPRAAPGQDVFRVNAVGTFHVFEAAAACGIRRVVQASSINALGAFYSIGAVEPRYLPMDEAHPTYTTDPYSFSKGTVESIGAYYARRDGISSVALRLPGVHLRGTAQSATERRAQVRALLDEMAALPDAAWRERLAGLRAQTLEYRRHRPMEHTAVEAGTAPAPPDDPLFRMYAYSRYDLWAWIDERDAAQALVKGLTAEFEGDHVLFVNDRYNSLGYDARALIRLFFPDLADLRADLSGAASLISIDRARQLIGFEPEHSLRDVPPV